MGDMNIKFCRLVLSALVEEMRAEHPDIRPKADAYVMRTGLKQQWFFEVSSGPAKGFSAYVDADNAYDARYQGWRAWRGTK